MAAPQSNLAETDEQLAVDASARAGTARAAAERAYMQLYDRHARTLLAWLASRANRSDLDDMQQEIWQRVWTKLPEHFHGGNFRAWLFQIARNYLVDCSRRRPLTLIDDGNTQELGDGRGAEPWQALVDHEEQARLADCLGKLEQSKARLVRGRLQGDSYETIATELGITHDQAHKQFFDAKKMLEKCVQRGQS